MELGPVERVRAVGPVGERRAPADVSPAIAVEGAGRAKEDSHGSGAKRQERGLEDEDAELSAADEESSSSVDVMA